MFKVVFIQRKPGSPLIYIRVQQELNTIQYDVNKTCVMDNKTKGRPNNNIHVGLQGEYMNKTFQDKSKSDDLKHKCIL